MTNMVAVSATLAELEQVLAPIGPAPGIVVGSPPAPPWHPWHDVFGPDAAFRTLRDHAATIGAPVRLAGTFAASRVASAVARLQACSLGLLARAFVVDPAALRIQVVAGAVQPRVGLGLARLAVVEGDPCETEADLVVLGPAELAEVASANLDALIEALVAALSVGGRVSARLLACDAAFAWLAGLRSVASVTSAVATAGAVPPSQLLREQWRSVRRLSDLMVEHQVALPDGGMGSYLSRRVCCLEYRVGEAPARVYCPSCPLVPDEAIVARREAVERGERPSLFGDADRHGRARRPPECGLRTE